MPITSPAGAGTPAPETTAITPGAAGLVLTADLEGLPPDAASILENWVRVDRTRLRFRPGQELLADLGAGVVRTIARLFLPALQTFVGFISKGTTLYRGTATGGYAFSPVATSLSGNPVTLIPYRPALSGDPWMIGVDSLGAGIISPTGELLTLGLPAPVVGNTTKITEILTTKICDFHGDTGAANWVLTAGVDRSTPPVASGTPTAADVPALQVTGVEFTTTPGNATKGYSSIAGHPILLDLTKLQGGLFDSDEDDIIHIWVRMDRPALIEEVRVYLVCASGFSAGIVPGTSTTLNTDAFVKAFAPNDFTGFVEGVQSSDQAAELSQRSQVIDEYLESVPDFRTPESQDAQGPIGSPALDRAGTDVRPATQLAEHFAPGRNTWTEFGAIGRPLRKSDFTRIGNTAGRGWDTITGIVIVIQTTTNAAVRVACDDWYLTGGYPLDTAEPGTKPYDYRYTHYHLDTGDESNPSAIQLEKDRLLPMRQRITVQPAAPYAGPGATRIRQRIYRRGGTLNDNWYYVGRTTANGAAFIDALDDLSLAAAPTLEIDNFQAWPTVDATGTTLLAQPAAAAFGPVDGVLFACGDTRRPGHLYRSKAGRVGSWPPDLVTEVCAPSEELMHGFVYGGQAFVASRRRIFAVNLDQSSGRPIVQDTLCQKGFAGRWAFAAGLDGCYFVADDGIYLFTGNGSARKLSTPIDLLFRRGETTVDAQPSIDLASEANLRLFLAKGLLYFSYTDTAAVARMLVCDLRQGETWSRYAFNDPISAMYDDPEQPEEATVLGSITSGKIYAHRGMSDNGVPITAYYYGPHLTLGRPRERKQLGDVVIRTGIISAGATVVGGVNMDLTTQIGQALNPMALMGGSQLLDLGADIQRRVRTVQPIVSWVQPASAPVPGELHQIQITAYPLGEETKKRLGMWEPLGDEGRGSYLTGLLLTIENLDDVATKTFLVEYTRGTQTFTMGPFTASPGTGRRLIQFSWAGVFADLVRILPQDLNTAIIHRLEWLATTEPPNTTTYDSGELAKGDTYYTGLDLVVRATADLTATIWVDNVVVATSTVPHTSGAQGWRHLTLGPGYGHIYKLTLTSAAPFSVYLTEWILAPQPKEQTKWNQDFTLGGSMVDKWVKGVLLEVDTGGAGKTVQLDVDGIPATAFNVQTTGRQVVHISFAQVRGRVLRLRPIDAAPSRLWSVQWIFDEEPLALSRWETQLRDHQQVGWHSLLEIDVEYRSVQPVRLTLFGYDGSGALLFQDEYDLPAADGAAVERRKETVRLKARRAIQWKYLFTASQPFWLYREGSGTTVLPWGGAPPVRLQPFGNDDLDHNRSLGNASGIAATPNQPRG